MIFTAKDIDLYINTKYCGFYTLPTIEYYFDEYAAKATEMARLADWDEIVLYAIFAYDHYTDGILSADFMLLRMPRKRYLELCKVISDDCRMFFKRPQDTRQNGG